MGRSTTVDTGRIVRKGTKRSRGQQVPIEDIAALSEHARLESTWSVVGGRIRRGWKSTLARRASEVRRAQLIHMNDSRRGTTNRVAAAAGTPIAHAASARPSGTVDGTSVMTGIEELGRVARKVAPGVVGSKVVVGVLGGVQPQTDPISPSRISPWPGPSGRPNHRRPVASASRRTKLRQRGSNSAVRHAGAQVDRRMAACDRGLCSRARSANASRPASIVPSPRVEPIHSGRSPNGEGVV